MNLNVGDFLIRREGDAISIATVNERHEYEGDISYYLESIDSTGEGFSHGFFDEEELWDKGWRLLPKSVLRNVDVE